jgi:hypothetical protein
MKVHTKTLVIFNILILALAFAGDAT